MPACPRQIFIDLGANWGNTMHLYQDIGGGEPDVPWEVFAFEASPLIQPFLEEYTAYLNGERQQEPQSCLPRTGSTKHLNSLAKGYHCEHPLDFVMRACMFARLKGPLANLRADKKLNSSKHLASALHRAMPQQHHKACALRARAPHEAAHPAGETNQTRARFTHIPAAAGAATSWLRLYSPPENLIRGGAFTKGVLHTAGVPDQSPYYFSVPIVDVPGWLSRSFAMEDHVVLKVDIEGAEHDLMDALMKKGLLTLVDVLSLECHGAASKCKQLYEAVRRNAPSVRVLSEERNGVSSGEHLDGVDTFTRASEGKVDYARMEKECHFSPKPWWTSVGVALFCVLIVAVGSGGIWYRFRVRERTAEYNKVG